MSDLPTAPIPDSTPESDPTATEQARLVPDDSATADSSASPDSSVPEAAPPTAGSASASASTSTSASASTPPPAAGADPNATSAFPTGVYPDNSQQPTVPLNTDAWASAAQPVPSAPSSASAPRRNRPRFATILWGVLLLVFAGFMVAVTVLPVAPDPILLLLGAVIAIGVALVAAGIAAASRRAG
ncbi:hypothetical protein AB4Y63_03345 [Leifsonia sp. YAF41]|uniref:hypothetical protein n=1 Tax=Leifsonia sp. YAF41 TaxID=3233086 RepID=UPI003F98B521